MADEIISRDDNRVTVIAGVTDDASEDIVQLRIDPTTGRLLVSISGASSAVEEIVGTIDGANKTFTLTNSPDPATSLWLDVNGSVWAEVKGDFVLTANSIEFTNALPADFDVPIAHYRY